jgi:hypothetical protein
MFHSVCSVSKSVVIPNRFINQISKRSGRTQTNTIYLAFYFGGFGIFCLVLNPGAMPIVPIRIPSQSRVLRKKENSIKEGKDTERLYTLTKRSSMTSNTNDSEPKLAFGELPDRFIARLETKMYFLQKPRFLILFEIVAHVANISSFVNALYQVFRRWTELAGSCVAVTIKSTGS